MAEDQHEALIRAYIDEVFNGHRVDALDKYWDDDLTSHWLGMETIRGLPVLLQTRSKDEEGTGASSWVYAASR